MPTGFNPKPPKSGTVVTSSDLLSQNQALLATLKAEEALYPYLQFGPLSDAADLSILLNEPIQTAINELTTQEESLESTQDKLLDLTNLLTSLKEACEEELALARDSATTLSLVQQDANQVQFWYSETFDNPFKTDTTRTTCLVDTTNSYCSLMITQNEALGTITYDIDRANSDGLPGVNLELSSQGLRGNNVAPMPVFDKDISPRTDLGCLNDGDASTIWEWEWNFIYSPQPVGITSHEKGAMVAMQNATTWVDPLKETKYDWTTYLQWPDNSSPDKGPNDEGYPLATFTPRPTSLSYALGNKPQQCKLIMTATLSTPSPISMIVLTPVIYENTRPTVEKLEVSPDGITWILVGQGDLLGERALSLSEQQRVADLKKGSGSAIYIVPTNHPISIVRATFTGARYKPTQGFGHKFTSVYMHEHESMGIFDITSDSYWWERCPSDKIPTNTIRRSPNPELGSQLATLGLAFSAAGSFLGGTTSTKKVSVSTSSLFPSSTPYVYDSATNTWKYTGITSPTLEVDNTALNTATGVTSNLGQGLTVGSSLASVGQAATSAGGALGSSVGGALSTAGPYIQAAAAIFTIGSMLFGTTTTTKVEKTETGTDIFEGERSYVSLKEFNLVRSRYQTSSDYYSNAINFSSPVSQLALFVTEEIPSEWPTGSYISYFISTDGQNWNPITPLSMAGQGKGTAYLVDGTASQFFFKATFTRPDDDLYRSPILLNYAIQGIVPDSTLE